MAEHVSHEPHKMTQEEKEQIAQEKYGRSYDQLETDEKKAVGGTFRCVSWWSEFVINERV